MEPHTISITDEELQAITNCYFEKLLFSKDKPLIEYSMLSGQPLKHTHAGNPDWTQRV